MPLITGGGQERGRRGGTPPVAAIAGFAAAAHAAAAGFIEAGSMGPDSADDCAGSGAEDVGAVGVGAGASMVDVGAVDSSTVGAGARSGVGAIQSNGVRPGAAEAGAIRSSGLRLGAVEAGARLAALRDAIESAAVGCGAIVCGAGAPRLANTTCLALPGVRADGQVISLDLDGVAVSAGAACSSGKVATSHVLTAMGLGPLAGQAIRVSLPWNATQADVAAFAAAYSRMADRLRPALAPRAA
jgi:cysteine desulfurase